MRMKIHRIIIFFISLVLLCSVSYAQELSTIAIVDLEPKGGMNREDILQEQADSIATVLEAALLDIAEDRPRQGNAVRGTAEVETEGSADVFGEQDEKPPADSPDPEQRETITVSGNSEITIRGDSIVRIQGNTEIRFDNRLREQVQRLLDVTDKSMDVSEVTEISNLLRSAIIKTNAFEVVEREKVRNIIEEQKLRLQGLTADSDEMKQLGELLGAKRILLGTVGRLYGKIIITTRLVDVGSGKIVFANNTYSNEDDLVYYIEELARDIAAKGIAERQNVTIPEIRAFIKQKDYAAAREYLNVLLQNNPELAGNETQELNGIIIENLSEQNFKEAAKALRKKKYQLARDLINEAIAIRNEEKYFDLRNRIDVEEQEYIERQKEKEERQRLQQAELEKRRRERSTIGFGERVRNYYSGITVNGFLVGGTYNVPTSLDFDFNFTKLTDFGGELIIKGEIFDPPNAGNTSFNWMGYLGLNAQYISFEGTNTVMIRPYLSPFLSWGLKLGNFIIDIGFDGGGVFWIGNNFSRGYMAGVTGGAVGLFEIKMYRRFGIFGGAKLEYVYFPANVSYSNLYFRLIGGVSF